MSIATPEQEVRAEPNTRTLPKRDWIVKWTNHFKAREAFVTILVGPATGDFVVSGVPVRDYLPRLLIGNFPNQVRYARDEGITFPAQTEAVAKAQKESFLRYSGLGAEDDGGEKDDIAKLLNPTASGPGQLPREPLAALRAIIRFLENAPRKSAMAVIDRLDLILPGAADTATMQGAQLELLGLLARAGTSDALDRSLNPLFLLAPNIGEVHPKLRSIDTGITIIKVPLPSYEDRLEYIRRKVGTGGWALEEGLTPESFAAMTAGLFLRHVEEIFLRFASTEPVTRAMIRTKKSEGILNEYGGVIEVLEPDTGLEGIGGAEHFKRWARRWLIGPAAKGVKGVMPMVAILSGPPGTGKTEMAKAVAKETGWNVVIWRQGKLKAGLVGASERNQEKAFEALEVLAPCIVIADEADQQFRRLTGGTGGGGDAVEGTLFGATLEFMADPSHQDRIPWLLLSNRPDQLDAALASRADVRIPILPPESDEARADILGKLVLRHKLPVPPADVLVEVAGMMADWSGRDMMQAVKKAVGLVGLGEFDLADALREAARTRRALQRADAAEMTKLAIAECNDTDLLPDQYRDQAPADRKQLMRDIAELRQLEGSRKGVDLDI